MFTFSIRSALRFMKQYFVIAACLIISCGLLAQDNNSGKPNPHRTAIGGYIRTARKQPIKDVKVFVYLPDNSIIASGFTDAKGHYETSGVAPGSYSVRVVYPSLKRVIINGVPVAARHITPLNLSTPPPAEDSMYPYSALVPGGR